MYTKLFGFLLFASQIILNESHVIRETTGDIINVSPILAPAPAILPEGYVRFPDVHSAYKVYTTAVSWVEARNRCIADGAHLAIADTVEKIERIYAMQSEVHDWIGVGIQRSNTTNDWVRVDNGLPLASIPWKKNNPDAAGNCAAISFDGMSLVNYYCATSLNFPYACEISI